MSGKQVVVAAEGKQATSEEEAPKKEEKKECRKCCQEVKELVSCPKCRCRSHCSTECMKEDESHPLWCSWICRLERLETQKRMKQEINMVDAEKLP